MDLRVKKTLINIKKAFFDIKKRKPLDKISVKELSEKAMINKATFYLHYKDIYDLSEKVEKDLIDEMMTEIKKCKLQKNRESYHKMIETVNKTVLSYYDQIIVVFTDNKNSRFVEHFQNSIMEYICTEIPEFRNNDEIKLMISYMLYGTYHILSKSDYNKERLIKLSSEFALVLTNI